MALNTLTGDDIDESRLGKVPSATSADTAATAAAATSARNADTVNGISVQKIFAKQPNGATGGTIFQTDYFLLTASCAGGNADLILAGQGVVEVNAAAHSIIQNSTPSFMSSTDLRTAPLDLLGAGTEGSATVTVSATDGRVSTVVIGAANAPAFQSENVCAYSGTVTSG